MCDLLFSIKHLIILGLYLCCRFDVRRQINFRAFSLVFYSKKNKEEFACQV